MQDCLFIVVQFWKDGAVVHQEEVEALISYFWLWRLRCRGVCVEYPLPQRMSAEDRCADMWCRHLYTEVYICQMFRVRRGQTYYYEPQYHYLRDD